VLVLIIYRILLYFRYHYLLIQWIRLILK
jgi:hypothetical protein